MTCERGREAKCKREGLDILRYYASKQQPKNEGDSETSKKLTLDEEIALGNEESNDFGIYDTGCGGNVLVMCTLPESTLIPPIQTEWSEANNSEHSAKRKATEESSNNDVPISKRARIEEKEDGLEASKKDEIDVESNQKPESKELPPWDPVETVQQVLHDLDSSSTSAPSSRFVTRMIPIQATCFASLEEIGLTAEALVQKYLKDVAPSTFAVNIKRRNCSTVTRDEIINAVAGAVLSMEGAKNEWKVNLKSPNYTIMVEICKTLCGMTIVKDYASYRNFNLLEIREAQQTSKEEAK